MDVKSGLLASSTARLPVPQPTSRAFPFARAAANAMKSGASDRLWRPICNSYLSPLEVGKVEFLESSGDCAIVIREISNEVNPTSASRHLRWMTPGCTFSIADRCARPRPTRGKSSQRPMHSWHTISASSTCEPLHTRDQTEPLISRECRRGIKVRAPYEDRNTD